MPTDAPLSTTLLALQGLRATLDGAASRLMATADPVAVSRYLADDVTRALRTAQEQVADVLPALTPEQFRELANGDHAVRAEIERFRDGRWSLVDVSALEKAELFGAREDLTGDGAGWTILRGSSRFEVREVPRYEARKSGGPGKLEAWYVHDNQTNEQAEDYDAADLHGLIDADAFTEGEARNVANTMQEDGEVCYVVWDTENDADARGYEVGVLSDCGQEDYDPTDEESARAAAEAANVEDYRTNAYGWPFAQNYAAAIDERDADDFDAAGFVVARHEPSGQVYAGIDGGGYDFIEAHWSRVYLRKLLNGPHSPEYTSYVPTRDGLRRVVRGDKAGV